MTAPFRLAHHVPGRLRLRLQPGYAPGPCIEQARAAAGQALQDVEYSAASRSLVLYYDPLQAPPALAAWGDEERRQHPGPLPATPWLRLVVRAAVAAAIGASAFSAGQKVLAGLVAGAMLDRVLVEAEGGEEAGASARSPEGSAPAPTEGTARGEGGGL